MQRSNSRDDDICFFPATELARLYRARKVSPIEVMRAVLARIDAVNPAVNAYVTVARDSALAAARRATRMLGRKATTLPLLHGVPVSIKDLFATEGIRTTWGSLIYKDHVPDGDDLVVQRLKAAGAIVVGKTNAPEFGAGGNTFNAVFGATRNPWNLALRWEINGELLDNYTQWFNLTYGITVTGLPAISVLCGFTRKGVGRSHPTDGHRHRERILGINLAWLIRGFGAPTASAPLRHLTR